VNKISRIKKYSVLQHDSTDCGAACLVSVIRFYGGNSTLERIRKLSGTSQTGTTMLGLYQAASQAGFDATGFEASIKDLIGYAGILILHVTINNGLEHYMVNFGFERGKFIIWDPGAGLTNMTESELEKIWLSRKCLEIVPNSTFRSEKENKYSKIAWLRKAIAPEKEMLLASIGIGILISALGLVMALFTQKLIDKILPSHQMNVLIISSLLVFILLCSRLLLTAFRQIFLLTQGKLFNIRIVDDFYSSLMFLPKSFFDTRKTGDFVARLNDTMRIQRVIADIAGIYIIDILILIVTLIMIFYYSAMSAVITLFFLPFFYIIVYRWNKGIISAQHSTMAGYASSESNFIDSLGGIAEIKGMNWQHNFISRNENIYSEFQTRAFMLGKIKIKLSLITGLSGTLYLVIVLVYASLQVMASKMTQGELMAILSLSSALLPSVLDLALINIPFSEAKVALGRMFEFTQITAEGNGVEERREPLKIEKITLKNISFRFPGRKLLLSDISMIVRKGSVVSIIGESGCGKSTLANLILRFYDTGDGQIMFNDNCDVNDIDMQTWRSRIGIIPQEIHIFNGTILQNLITEVSEENLRDMAATISDFGLSGFLDSFPAGLLTLVGEEGINLSGGQKQLLAFIRVLLKKPDILVIDEGTSGMDRGTEIMIMKLIMRLKSEMGILLISHRINMVRDLSDYIYLIENRCISDKGAHAELIQRDNLYKRFWDDFY